MTVRNPIKINNQIIHGRFLHMTDIHPDEFYKPGSSHDSMCHDGEGEAGEYGDAILGCDSPMILMNRTLQWIDDNLKDKIDFVVWTGDNIRHDNDRNHPRTEGNIFDMNEYVSDSIYQLFKNPDTENPRNLLVDFIPSLGNNDVYPHNLFAPGPTLQTREMYKIWSHFIPQNQLHIFNRGAYFFREVIPGQLAVLSINTLYLFQSNPLVDNCDNKKDPGYKLFEWLGIVLKELRARNMKVWLTGHVPPNEKNYDLSCLRKYIVWSYEYRDIIVGGLYGHMNIDHFIPLDAKAAYKSLEKLQKKKKKKKGKKGKKGKGKLLEAVEVEDIEDDELTQQPPMKITGGIPHNKVSFMEGLKTDLYGDVKEEDKSGVFGERYSIAHVTASVIPTFNPGLRVWEYNITDLSQLLNNQKIDNSWDDFFAGVDKYMDYLDKLDEASVSDFFTMKKDRSLPPKKPDNLPLGPAYTPQTFTPLRYTQYYVDLANVNKGEKPFDFEYEYSTDDKLYKMESLTVNNWLQLSRRFKTDDELWNTFRRHSFVDSNYENLGYG